MITKRTRALSIIATVAMIVSMLACFVIPASAEDDVASVKAMYADVLANASADAEGALAAALEADYADADTAKTELAAVAGTSITLKDGIKPRVAYTSAYAAAGYTGTNWSISKAEDWRLMISGVGAANAGSGDPQHSYYVTDDIDFENVAMAPIACFRGHLYGQNHTFKNVNITVTYTASSANDGINKGVALVSRSGAGAVAGQVWRDLGITGTMTMTADNSGSSSNTIYAGTHGASTGNTTFTNCWSDVTMNITAKGGSKPVYIGGIAGAASGAMTDCRFSGNMVVSVAGTGAPYTGGILAYGNSNPLNGCTFDGTMQYTSTNTGSDNYVGGILGAAGNANTKLDHCAFTGLIKDTSNNNVMSPNGNDSFSGLVGRTFGVGINNCISDGEIWSRQGPATAIANFNNAGSVYNSIAAGVTLTGGGLEYGSALKSHSTTAAGSVYAVNMPYVYLKGDATAMETANAVTTNYVSSAAEAAYKINNNYDSTGGTQTYYTIKDGKVAFGTVENQIRKLTVVRGEQTFAYYAAQGTVDLNEVLPGYADAAAVAVTQDVGGYNVAVNDGKINMTGDVTVTVTDTAKSAKAALAAEEELGWASKDLNVYTETNTWLAAADDLAANSTDVAAILAKAAELRGLIVGTKTLTIDTTAYSPYSRRTPYNGLGISSSNTSFAITTAQDWLGLIGKWNDGTNFTLSIHVMRNIDFENVPMTTLNYGATVTSGNFDGHGHYFENINIYQASGSSANQSVGLVSRMNSGSYIKNLGIKSGTITNTATTASGIYTGVFVGCGNGQLIYNCWVGKDVTVTCTNAIARGGVTGFVGGNTGTIENCYSAATVNATNGHANGMLGWASGAGSLYNSIDATTVNTKNETGAMHYFHNNTISAGTQTNFNSMAVGKPAAEIQSEAANAHTFTYDGKTYPLSAAGYNEAYSVDTVEEAAWMVNKNYVSTNSQTQVFYTLVDGELAFGTADNQIRRIAIARGTSETYVYAVPGEEVDLYAINPALEGAEGLVADNEIGDITETGKFTMVNNDVVVTVSDSLDSAKAALIEKIDAAWDAEDLNMYTQTQAWLATAKDLVANGDNAETIINHVIAADTVLAGELTLDTTAYAPYSKKAQFPNNPTTAYSINRAEDWLAVVAAKYIDGVNLHVNRDIDFKGEAMLPLGINQNTGLSGNLGSTGILDGHGYTFKDINVVSAASTNWRTGVSLVAGLNGGTIQNLGLTGKVTNTTTEATYTSDSRTIFTAAFVAGKHNGGMGAIKNCWSDVDVTGPSTATAGLAAFNATGTTQFTIENCINYGTITSTTNGAVYAFYDDAISNCINAGELVTTGVAAAFGTANNTRVTNSYTVSGNGIYNTGSKQYYNSNVVSAKEAAYKATNGTTYFTVKDGVPAFGTATDRVFKVELTGDYEAVGYYLPGEVANLYELGLPEYDDTTFSGADVVDGMVTVGTADLTITVSYGDSQKAGALEDLNELIALYEQYDPNLLDASSTVATWLANAAAAKETNTYAAIRAQVIAADAIVVKLAEGAKPAFADYDLYAEFNTANNWSVATAADWLKAVALGTDAKVLSANIYITDDVDFGVGCAPFAPLGAGGVFTGNIYGNDHVFKNVNVSDATVTVADTGIGLISKLGGSGTVERWGIASGVIRGDQNNNVQQNYTAAFFGALNNDTCNKIYKLWNAADVYGDAVAYGGAAALFGGLSGDNSSRTATINGFYNLGTITGQGTHTSGAHYTGVLSATGTNHRIDAITNTFNAGEILYNGSEGGAAKNTQLYIRLNLGATGPFINHASSTTVSNEMSSGTLHEKALFLLTEDAYASGEIGYVLNGNQNLFGESGTIKDESGRAIEPIYFSFDAEGKVTFGTEATQIRRVTFVVDGNEEYQYVNQGAAIDFSAYGGANSDYTVGGEPISIDGYMMGDADITITVTPQYDVEEYNTAKAAMEAIVNEYEGYDFTLGLFTNNDAMKARYDLFVATLAENDPATVIATYEANNGAIEVALVSGKYVPFATGANYSALNPTEYGIYEVGDWNAAVAAGTNANLHLMNDIDFNNAETATFTTYSGIFDGHDNALLNIKITTPVSNSAALFRVLTGTVKNVEITGAVDVKLGTMEEKVATAQIAVVSASGGTVLNVTNRATITADAYATGRVYIGTMTAALGTFTNCTNYGAVTVNGVGNYIGVGGMNGRANVLLSGNKNYGNVTLNTQANNGAYAYAGGICGATAGDSLADVENYGTITVTGGTHVAVGGIQGYGTNTNTGCTIGNAKNEGAINVTMAEGASIVYAGGIIGQAMWPVNDGAVLSNSGAITVEAANAYTGAYVGGIAGTMSTLATGNFTATNTGAIKVGGLDAEKAEHVADQVVGVANNATITENENGSLTVCDHAGTLAYAHVAETKTHTADCSECSYLATLDCEGEWSYGAKEDFVVDGTTITSTHAMTCTLCEEVYDEACVGTLVSNPADCTADTVAHFDHGCGREDVVMIEGHDAHAYPETWTTEGATPGYERRDCTCADCEGYEERLIDITFSTSCEGFVPGNDATVTLTLASGKLNAGTFTVSVGEGFTVKSVNGVEGATFTLAEAMNAGDSIEIVVTAGATTYVDGEVTITITEAKNAADEAVDLADVVATVAINITPGDADGNGSVNLIDAIIALRESVQMNDEGVCNTANADMDGDGDVDADDAVAIVRAWLKKV